MSESPNIHNVSARDFQTLVIENSTIQPVLVDFWADWCQPCQSIMPVLAKLAQEYAGKFVLAKVNTDQEQELATHFGIKSLPTMKMFVNGQMVDERMGVIPESEIRAFIDQFITSGSSQWIEAANLAHQQGHTEEALQLLNQALAKDPDNADLKIHIAKMVFTQNDSEGALAMLDSLSEDENKKDDAIRLRAEISLARQLQDVPALEDIERKLSDNPNDPEALLHKSHHLVALEKHEEAMDCLLKIMKIDRQFRDDAGRSGLLALFDMLGGDHPSVQKYRRKMFTLLH